ncbi:beta-ketoacyl synthase N-terminal-like domain-containing protein [Sphingobacterium gobiense]|uniref:Beta-ketoacyl synthase n=1 Tax=Sphingobacterium gobiense TaxID=1382456 RepID=A0A2S9JL82_9SPHI|nr:beta-ketoacyl synthase N-terminal-like domain-containing protein [Sphingobacterium gobiense]PRD53915.1 beta-ketoacyl synthase [Sphingobacterium gobiense]
MAFDPIYIHDINCVSPLGLDLASNWTQSLAGNCAIVQHDVGRLQNVYTAKITKQVADNLRTPLKDSALLERMLFTAAKPIVERHVPTSRTALILSTTKGNIALLEGGRTADAQLPVLAKKMAEVLGFQTQPIVVSQACVSGLLALSVAKRLIQIGQYDDAVVLAGDVVSEFVLSGFQAFQAMSPFPCKPFDKDRAGVSLGEAAACIYVSKEKGEFKILGEASINDANHISGPSRTGEGLVQSVLCAEQEANIDIKDIDFISAHGTATLYNDEMEAIAFHRLGLQDVPIHSLKGYYGHTLGASGLLETVIALQCMRAGVFIRTKGFETLGVSQPLNIIQRISCGKINRLLKTASGFGGSNAAMIIEKT